MKQAAQNQHYVPKFILRNFLCDENHQRVRVYDKETDREFTTSIDNVMAERRFNEFEFGEYLASFEDIACRIEDSALPAYRQVLADGKLSGGPDQQAALAFLMAFQFVRTRAHRQHWADLELTIREKIEAIGGRIEDVPGYEELTENNLKKQHLLSLQKSIVEFGPHIAMKHFVLFKAAEGRSFYLGDNPVTMHNDEDHGPYGNIGLAVRGIQIYMPLSAKFAVGALCPTLLDKMRDQIEEGRRERQIATANAVRRGKITIDQLVRLKEQIRPFEDDAELLVSRYAAGGPVTCTNDVMDFINSLQTLYARRFVICKHSHLTLARRHNREFPKFRKGMRIRAS
jgi:hypothetical protein